MSSNKKVPTKDGDSSAKPQQAQSKGNAVLNKENNPSTSVTSANQLGPSSSSLNSAFSFGKSTESSPKDQKTASTMPATAKEPFSFATSAKPPAASQTQLNTSLFTFGNDKSSKLAAQKPAFGESTGFGGLKAEAGTSSIRNGFASFAISSSTTSTNEHPTANSTSTSKDLLHAYIEDMVKSQVKEEVQKLFKDGELDDELRRIVKGELLKLICDFVKKV